MNWLQTLDSGLFRWLNHAFTNSFFDSVMPFLSGNLFFAPAFLLACVLLAWKGGARGRICVMMLALAIIVGDVIVSSSLKNLIDRPRPFHVITDAHVPVGIGRTGSGSMPSSHAVNWFAATMVLLMYYRRSWRFMLPLALLVGFSRIYNGVHYPGDILVGAIVGAGCGSAVVFGLDALWRWTGRRWFPLWWPRFPSLINPRVVPPDPKSAADDPEQIDRQWMRLGYGLIFLLLFANLAYLASGRIELSEDEAYQWTWSKHLALSYYSKPLLIAVTQFLGTTLWGDTAFGVRFFAPVISAIISLVIFRFLARAANARVAFWLTALLPTIPLLALGSVLMTIDPLSALFWTLAMVSGWKAIQENSTVMDWIWVGLWMGLGFLSKYTALFQLLSWAVVFALWPPARKQLRRAGPWVALLVNALCTLPVVIWNMQHDWITVQHVAEGGNFGKQWAPTPAYLWDGLKRFTTEFVGSETLLLNPFFFLPIIWASVAFWRRNRNHPLMVYFFSMGAPLFLCYFLFTLHSRVLPNWIAPSILPLFCLAVLYWDDRWRRGFQNIRYCLYGGLAFGSFVVILMHDSTLLPKIINQPPPKWMDSWRRVEGWKETAQQVEEVRQKFMKEGRPVFIIGGDYGVTGQLSFYIPEARKAVGTQPLVFFRSTKFPVNQFYFWPGYRDRKGQNALFVQEQSFWNDGLYSPPQELLDEFESVTSLGEYKITYLGRVVRRIQIMECRGLK